MAIFNSSSLAFSDLNKMRHDSGLIKNMSNRVSKQHLVEQKMFGSKRKNIRIGKNFRKSGKGIMKGATSAHMSPKEKGISPSVGEFDKMMSDIVGKASKSSSKKMFKQKDFG